MVQVAVVILTYNRRDLVQRCLAAVLGQTRPCDRVMVIDNASTDDTLDVLRAFASAGVEVHSLSKNLGAAGGFNAGMHLGHQTGADFVWVMDDDVIAAPDALAELLQAYEVLDGAGVEAPFVISTARSPQGLMTNTPGVDRRSNALHYENWPHLLSHGLVPVSRSTFVSVLFARRTIDRHGLPFAAMFIWGEDFEYTLRVTRNAPGYMVGRSQVEHVRAVAGMLDIRTEHDRQRIAWHRFQVRNNIYTSRRYARLGVTVKHTLHVGRLALRLTWAGQLRKAWTVATGIMLGFVFSPESHVAMTDPGATSAATIRKPEPEHRPSGVKAA